MKRMEKNAKNIFFFFANFQSQDLKCPKIPGLKNWKSPRKIETLV
jgi:hypothetical protein